ncbi:MAG: bifunctional 5,10-methylenetetrahydrofolate dehydrogenase/5,10-methenyltetrahydrofolate cyclohydrolase [Candidatus Omnitrophica bacterium]|nr:bifunctional 5,10-methylenetetrahydrofolate dehydrogenase/5,10-methenyltetrahydrofolate cyclohydrolase [Candidatus Omnitrophota bacterium]
MSVTTHVLDGKAIARQLNDELRAELSRLGVKPGQGPRMATIYDAQNQASGRFSLAQRHYAEGLGLTVEPMALRHDMSRDQVQQAIEQLNRNAAIHGIFVQNPLPQQIDPQWVSTLIDPRKDVEGIHPQNSIRRFFGKARIGSCTALAVMRLIEETKASLEGKEAVVVGHSEIVGRPVGMLLLDKLATTTICHVATQNLRAHVERADILIVAVGQPRLIKGAWIKPGAIVIDVGINVVGNKVVGDVEFETASTRASFISPVPGGVGPVTVMMVMKNLVEAYKLQQSI